MRLIDADALMFYVRQHWEELYPKDGAMIDAILVTKTVDAVPVVRCKDCKWRGEPGCAVYIVDESDKPKDDDFCSWGERKENGKTD